MLTIGKLGQAAGVKVPTIRYYEQIGLLPEAERSAGNQRLYSRKALDRLTFVRHARELGFTLDAIRDQGQFPAYCPMCRVDWPPGTDHTTHPRMRMSIDCATLPLRCSASTRNPAACSSPSSAGQRGAWR